jgi:hypothetical protein
VIPATGGGGKAAPLIERDAEERSPSFYAASDEPAVGREELVEVLARRAKRVRQCRSVPASLLVYALLIGAMVTHCRVEPAFQFESALLNELVVNTYFDIYSLQTPTQWFYWARNSFLPTVLYDPAGVPDSDDYYSSIVKAPQVPGRVCNNYAQIIGGIRVAQTRAARVACPGSSSTGFARLYNDSCWNFASAPSGATDFGDADAAQAGGVEEAFAPSGSGGNLLPALVRSYNDGPFFQIYVDALTPLADGQAIVNALEDARWVDEGTSAVAIQLALYNGQTDFFATVEMAVTFTSGGRLDISSRVGSFSAEPYRGYEWIYIFDFVLVVYSIYLLRSTTVRFLEAVRRPGDLLSRVGNVLQFWHVLDVGATCSLLTSIVLWISFNAKLSTVRDAIGGDAGASKEAYSGSAHASTANAIFDAFEIFASFKIAAVWSLIFLSLRLFKYFQFQPRLAVIADSLTMAFKDLAHFALLFIVLMCCFGTWGHFMFGTQAPDWRSINTSIVSVIRYMMYDYDLIAMEATGYVAMADFFFASYMILITNLIFWMFLASIFESYTNVRIASANTPSIVDEGAALLRSTESLDWCCSCCGRAGAAAEGEGGLRGARQRRAPGSAEMLAAFAKGSMARGPITASRITAVFGTPRADAEALVEEARVLEALRAGSADGGLAPADDERAAGGGGAAAEAAAEASRSASLEARVNEARETRHLTRILTHALSQPNAGGGALVLRALAAGSVAGSRGQSFAGALPGFGGARSRPATRSALDAGASEGELEAAIARAQGQLDALRARKG